MTDQNETSEFLTLFEKERGFAFTREGRFFNISDVPALAAKALSYARRSSCDLADAAEHVAPNVWDEAANHFVCTYDLRRAIVNHMRAELTKKRKTQVIA